MDAITAALVALQIDTNNAQKYAEKLWEQDVTTPGLLAFVDKDVLKAAGITSPIHVNAILAGAKNVSVASATVGAVQYDAFLTHNWGGGNHDKVSEINKALKREGIRTWFDEEKMTGHHVLDDMTRGIDQSSKVVVFVTKTYMEKVMGDDNTDNCKREFLYADKTKGGSVGMIPVVMEDGMRKHSEWKGVLGMVLGDALHHDLSPSVVGAARERNIKALVNAIKGKTDTDGGPVKPHLQMDLSTINGMSATEIVGLLKDEGTKNAKLAAKCCEKIGQIIKEDDVARMQFVNAGACEPVMAVLRAWTKTDAVVVQWACAAIKVLSWENAERTLLGSLGACEAVVTALIAWGTTDVLVAEQGCDAVFHLSIINDANRTRLGNCGACEAVIAVLVAWGKMNARVAEYGCCAVGSFSVDGDNRTKLGNGGACEAVVAILIAWGKTDAEVADCGCCAVNNLSTNSSTNKQKFIKVGAVAAVEGTVSNSFRDLALSSLSR